MNQRLHQFYLSKGVSKEKIGLYIGWLNRFTVFSNGIFDHISYIDLQKFADHLESSGSESGQIKQAQHAVVLYIEDYLNKTIEAIPPSRAEEKTSSTPIATWQQAKDKFTERMRLRHYAYNTEKTYQEWIRRFILYSKLASPEKARPDHVKKFLTHLAIERNVASSTQNQAFNALLFFFREIIGIELGDFRNTIRARKSNRIPVVLTTNEIKEVFKYINDKFSLPLTLIYASGIRVTECVRLRIQDLDFGNRSLVVRSEKGDKDRVTLLPEFLHDRLKEHLKTVRQTHENDLAIGHGAVYLPGALEKKYPNANKEWNWQYVFPAGRLSVDPRSGIVRRHHLDQQLLQKAMRKAVTQAGITKKASVHTLRHSFATHLLQSGYDIGTIQDLLGHKDVSTTMIYTHVIKNGPLGVKSPAEILK